MSVSTIGPDGDDLDYSESWVDANDPQNSVLEALAKGQPWVFVVANDAPGDGVALKVETGGGIRDSAMLRNLVEMTLKALS